MSRCERCRCTRVGALLRYSKESAVSIWWMVSGAEERCHDPFNSNPILCTAAWRWAGRCFTACQVSTELCKDFQIVASPESGVEPGDQCQGIVKQLRPSRDCETNAIRVSEVFNDSPCTARIFQRALAY